MDGFAGAAHARPGRLSRLARPPALTRREPNYTRAPEIPLLRKCGQMRAAIRTHHSSFPVDA